MKTIGQQIPKKIKAKILKLLETPDSHKESLRLMTLYNGQDLYRFVEFHPETNEVYMFYEGLYLVWNFELKDGLSYGEYCTPKFEHSADIVWDETRKLLNKEIKAQKAIEAKKAAEEAIKAEEKAKRAEELRKKRAENMKRIQAARKEKLQAARKAQEEETKKAAPKKKQPVKSK